VTEPPSGIIGNAINRTNMLDKTTKDPTESQKVIADILNDDRNCFDLFSSVNQLLVKRKIVVNKWCEGLYPTPYCFVQT
jgi:hypothetical protein